MGSMDCDDAFLEVYQLLQPCFAQDADNHFPVSRELHNSSSLTTFVIAELPGGNV